MEQSMLTNTELIINKFNDKFLNDINTKIIDLINNEKDKIINDLKVQINNEVTEKIKSDFEIIFPDITNNIIVEKKIYEEKKSKKNLIYDCKLWEYVNLDLRHNEYFINYKHSYCNDVEILFLFTNYSSITFYSICNSNLTKHNYIGKYKLPDIILYIFNNFINGYFGDNHNSKILNDDVSLFGENTRKQYAKIVKFIDVFRNNVEQVQIRYFSNPFSNNINHVNDSNILYNKNDNKACSVCLDDIDEVYALVPCGHTNICTSCYDNKKLSQCPVCRKDLNMRIKIYK